MKDGKLDILTQQTLEEATRILEKFECKMYSTQYIAQTTSLKSTFSLCFV